jgi:aconitate hydratase
VFLLDIYPTPEQVADLTASAITSDLYSNNYADIYSGNQRWNEMHVSKEMVFDWDERSTILQEPGFLFDGFDGKGGLSDIDSAYALAFLADSITTDHISPAGKITEGNPAAVYLEGKGIHPPDFISFGARRGNHEVMARGTFSNPRLRNKLMKGQEGGFTVHIPTGDNLTIYDASLRYQADAVPLIIVAGKAYGAGSSRDWAAKGTYLLGVRAVLAESFERIHRTNLVCMGILPLQFKDDQSAAALSLTGYERFTITGISSIDRPGGEISVQIAREDGRTDAFSALIRIDTPLELSYFKAGGLMRKLRADF